MISAPKHKENAIEAAAFALAFSRLPDSEAFQRLADAMESLSEELPGVEKRQAVRFQIGVGHAPLQSQSEHTDIARFISGPAGDQQWRVSLEGPLLTVRCQAYTHYDEVWARAQRYLTLCVNALGEQYAPREASLQFIDRFDYLLDHGEDLNASYDICELFQTNSDYLTPKSYKAGPLWHVFQGWFDNCDRGRRHLHQLNVSSTPVSEDSFAAIIDYRGSTNLIGEEGEGNHIQFNMEGSFAHMHRVNVQLIKGLLTPAKLEKIGLGGQE